MTDKKIALVLSGGSRFGAYQVGVVRKLYEKGLKPSIFCGVSVGGLNGAHLAQYDHTSSALQAIDDLADRWYGINTRDVWRHHVPFGFLHLPWKKSPYDSSPLRRLIRRWFDPVRVEAAGNELYLGAVSLQSGQYHVFCNDCVDPHEALAASAANAMFEPRELSAGLCADGGLVCATPLRAAFKAGAERVYVVLTEAEKMAQANELDTFRQIGPRHLAILARSVFELDLGWALAENELAAHGAGKKRHVEIKVIRPPEALVGDPLDFDPQRSRELVGWGYEDAASVVVV
jgi:NTE family protein